MSKDEVNLASVFRSVTQALSENQQNLDAADGYNGDHGTNMVQTFQTITAALQKKQGSSERRRVELMPPGSSLRKRPAVQESCTPNTYRKLPASLKASRWTAGAPWNGCRR